jgi:hypothetical protein
MRLTLPDGVTINSAGNNVQGAAERASDLGTVAYPLTTFGERLDPRRIVVPSPLTSPGPCLWVGPGIRSKSASASILAGGRAIGKTLFLGPLCNTTTSDHLEER